MILSSSLRKNFDIELRFLRNFVLSHFLVFLDISDTKQKFKILQKKKEFFIAIRCSKKKNFKINFIQIKKIEKSKMFKITTKSLITL